MSEVKTKSSMKEAIASHYSSFALSEEQIAALQSMQENPHHPQDKLKSMELQLATRAVGTTPQEKILSLQQGLDPHDVPSISTSFRYEQMQIPSATTTTSTSTPTSSSSRWLLLSAISVIGLLALLGWFVFHPFQKSPSAPVRALLTAVVADYQQPKTLWIRAESIETLRKTWPQLPFSPMLSVHLPNHQWRLVGGNTFVTPQQSMVVLRYQHRQTKQYVSLYQTTPWNQQIPAAGWIGTFRNVHCKVWYEQGLLQILLQSP